VWHGQTLRKHGIPTRHPHHNERVRGHKHAVWVVSKERCRQGQLVIVELPANQPATLKSSRRCAMSAFPEYHTCQSPLPRHQARDPQSPPWTWYRNRTFSACHRAHALRTLRPQARLSALPAHMARSSLRESRSHGVCATLCDPQGKRDNDKARAPTSPIKYTFFFTPARRKYAAVQYAVLQTQTEQTRNAQRHPHIRDTSCCATTHTS